MELQRSLIEPCATCLSEWVASAPGLGAQENELSDDDNPTKAKKPPKAMLMSGRSLVTSHELVSRARKVKDPWTLAPLIILSKADKKNTSVTCAALYANAVL
eukprot:5587953-Amphidinium_carterae.2